MSAGYGRGHYGSEQLAPRPPGRGWLGTVIVLAGVGAVAWLLWPRKVPVPPYARQPSPPPPPTRDDESGRGLGQESGRGLGQELEQIARSKGFSSTEAFENSVVATARELEASGAQVELGPHLQHLTPRLET